MNLTKPVVKIGIVGSRNFPENMRWMLDSYVDTLPHNAIIVSGGARGIDTWAVEAAVRNNLAYEEYIPDKYDEHGNYRGHWVLFERNTKIIENSDRIVAFWHDNSSGTKDSIDKAKKAGKEVEIIMSSGQKMKITPKVKPPKQLDFNTSMLSPYADEDETSIWQAVKQAHVEIQDASDEISGFTGKYFPLSIYSPSRVTLDDTIFPSAAVAFVGAQMLTYAERQNLSAAMSRIRNLAEWASRNVKSKAGFSNAHVWKSVLTALYYQKFTNDNNARDLLLSTEGKSIPDDLIGEVGYGAVLEEVRRRIVENDPYPIKDPVSGPITYALGWEEAFDNVASAIYVMPVNCSDTIDHPFSAMVVEHFPSAFSAYKAVQGIGEVKTSQPLLFKVSNDKFVLSFPTRSDVREEVTSNTIALGLQSIINGNAIKDVAVETPLIMPQLGLDEVVGKVKWDVSKNLLERMLYSFNRPVYVHYKK